MNKGMNKGMNMKLRAQKDVKNSQKYPDREVAE